MATDIGYRMTGVLECVTQLGAGGGGGGLAGSDANYTPPVGIQ